jgi:hypothetical protein
MSQPLIKILLLAALAVVGYYAVKGSRRALHRVVWRGFVMAAVVAGVAAVIYPNGLTKVAVAVGVGRGTDLLLYIMVVTFMLVSVVLFRRLNDLERRYVTLARAVAIAEATQAHTDGAASPAAPTSTGGEKPE